MNGWKYKQPVADLEDKVKEDLLAKHIPKIKQLADAMIDYLPNTFGSKQTLDVGDFLNKMQGSISSMYNSREAMEKDTAHIYGAVIYLFQSKMVMEMGNPCLLAKGTNDDGTPVIRPSESAAYVGIRKIMVTQHAKVYGAAETNSPKRSYMGPTNLFSVL